MVEKQGADEKKAREQLIAALNEDLAREYQAIIAYVVCTPRCLRAPNS